MSATDWVDFAFRRHVSGELPSWGGHEPPSELVRTLARQLFEAKHDVPVFLFLEPAEGLTLLTMRWTHDAAGRPEPAVLVRYSPPEVGPRGLASRACGSLYGAGLGKIKGSFLGQANREGADSFLESLLAKALHLLQELERGRGPRELRIQPENKEAFAHLCIAFRIALGLAGDRLPVHMAVLSRPSQSVGRWAREHDLLVLDVRSGGRLQPAQELEALADELAPEEGGLDGLAQLAEEYDPERPLQGLEAYIADVRRSETIYQDPDRLMVEDIWSLAASGRAQMRRARRRLGEIVLHRWERYVRAGETGLHMQREGATATLWLPRAELVWIRRVEEILDRLPYEMRLGWAELLSGEPVRELLAEVPLRDWPARALQEWLDTAPRDFADRWRRESDAHRASVAVRALEHRPSRITTVPLDVLHRGAPDRIAELDPLLPRAFAAGVEVPSATVDTITDAWWLNHASPLIARDGRWIDDLLPMLRAVSHPGVSPRVAEDFWSRASPAQRSRLIPRLAGVLGTSDFLVALVEAYAAGDLTVERHLPEGDVEVVRALERASPGSPSSSGAGPTSPRGALWLYVIERLQRGSERTRDAAFHHHDRLTPTEWGFLSRWPRDLHPDPVAVDGWLKGHPPSDDRFPTTLSPAVEACERRCPVPRGATGSRWDRDAYAAYAWQESERWIANRRMSDLLQELHAPGMRQIARDVAWDLLDNRYPKRSWCERVWVALPKGGAAESLGLGVRSSMPPHLHLPLFLGSGCTRTLERLFETETTVTANHLPSPPPLFPLTFREGVLCAGGRVYRVPFLGNEEISALWVALPDGVVPAPRSLSQGPSEAAARAWASAEPSAFVAEEREGRIVDPSDRTNPAPAVWGSTVAVVCFGVHEAPPWLKQMVDGGVTPEVLDRLLASTDVEIDLRQVVHPEPVPLPPRLPVAGGGSSTDEYGAWAPHPAEGAATTDPTPAPLPGGRHPERRTTDQSQDTEPSRSEPPVQRPALAAAGEWLKRRSAVGPLVLVGGLGLIGAAALGVSQLVATDDDGRSGATAGAAVSACDVLPADAPLARFCGSLQDLDARPGLQEDAWIEDYHRQLDEIGGLLVEGEQDYASLQSDARRDVLQRLMESLHRRVLAHLGSASPAGGLPEDPTPDEGALEAAVRRLNERDIETGGLNGLFVESGAPGWIEDHEALLGEFVLALPAEPDAVMIPVARHPLELYTVRLGHGERKLELVVRAFPTRALQSPYYDRVFVDAPGYRSSANLREQADPRVVALARIPDAPVWLEDDPEHEPDVVYLRTADLPFAKSELTEDAERRLDSVFRALAPYAPLVERVVVEVPPQDPSRGSITVSHERAKAIVKYLESKVEPPEASVYSIGSRSEPTPLGPDDAPEIGRIGFRLELATQDSDAAAPRGAPTSGDAAPDDGSGTDDAAGSEGAEGAAGG